MSYQLYAPVAIAAAQAYGIDPQIYLRQITQESGWNPNAVSPAGAKGINQFMDPTAAAFGIDPFDPEASMYAGAALMAQNLQMFGGDYSLALAAYNAGPGAVQQYGGIPPYAETQSYVQKILGGDGGGVMPEMGFPDWWPDWLGGGDDTPDTPEGKNPYDPTTWTGEERVNFLGAAGFQHQQGEGDSALWRGPDGRTYTESNAFDLMLGYVDEQGKFVEPNPPKPPAGSTASGFTLSGGQTRYGPNGEIIASSPSTSAAQSGFTLSPGQARFDASGKPIAMYPTASDPTAAIKLQQAQMDLNIKQQNLQFLREKHSFEMSQGMAREARETQAQIFNQQFSIQKLQTDIDQFNARMAFDQQQANIQNEERRQGRLSDLATQIGTLAQDPGDRAKYASTVLANSGMAFGQDQATGDMRTSDSLMPLESLLRQRSDLMGQQPQVNVPPVSGINLAGLQQPTANPAALPQPIDTTPGYDTGTGQPGIPYGGIALDPDEINAGAQWAPTPDFEGSGINLAAMMGALPQQPSAGGYTTLPLSPEGAQGSVQPLPSPDPANGRYMNLPLKAKGGIEDEAFIAGEGGKPELIVPLEDGRTAVLNEQQMDALGINLKRITKMAGGGIFDGLVKDDDRGMATSFLNEATTRAKAGTPWAGQAVPGPTFASSPGFDPIVAQLMASINAMETGVPAQAWLRNAALRRPAGVNEAPIRRSA